MSGLSFMHHGLDLFELVMDVKIANALKGNVVAIIHQHMYINWKQIHLSLVTNSNNELIDTICISWYYANIVYHQWIMFTGIDNMFMQVLLIQNQFTIMWILTDAYKSHSYKINWYPYINGVCMNIIYVELLISTWLFTLFWQL